MQRRLRRIVQAGAAAAAATMAAALGLAAVAPPSNGATSTFAFSRVAGSDRFATAAALATGAFPTGAATVLIATGFNFPDALAGNYLGGQDKAPVLLVNSTGPIPAATASALQTLKTAAAVILGGTSAVGPDVAAELAATPSSSSAGGNIKVSRIAGPGRDDTAEAVDTTPPASAVGTIGGKKTAFLARDDTFPDALGAGPIAYAQHFPIILTTPSALSSQAAATITALGIQQLLILGGTAAVSAATEQAANAAGAATLQRFSGADRSDTSHLLADYAIKNLGFSAAKFTVASGDQSFGGADALASGSFSAAQDPAPLLVTNSVTDPGQDVTFAKENAATETAGFAVGGTAPLPDATLAEIAAAITGTGTPASYTVTPSTQTNTNIAGGTAQNVTYTASGLTAGTPVDIALFACGNVSTSAGASTFLNSTNPGGSGNAAVQGTTGSAEITQVNGASVTAATLAKNVSPTSGGSLTFQVTDNKADCVVPVVFSNAAGDDLLHLGTNNQPSEAYGIGGAANFFVAATPGPITAGTVSNPSSTQFTENGATYTYAAGDVYQLVTSGSCAASTLAVFQKDLSTGDAVTGTYNPPPSGPGSTFCLNDTAPTAPTSLVATGNSGSGGGITVAFTGPGLAATPTTTGFDVYRAPATAPVITGGAYTCPTYSTQVNTSPQTPPGSPYTLIHTVPATTATSYSYSDTTVQPVASPSPVNPQVQFCYAVSSVDAGGQIGTAAQVTQNATGGVVPTAASGASAAPAFASAAVTAASHTVTVTYNQAITCASVDTDGSDYTVGVNSGSVTTAQTVSQAACSGISSTTVTITFSGSTLTPGSGQKVTVTAKDGTDGNTVANTSTPPQDQAVGDAVQSPTF